MRHYKIALIAILSVAMCSATVRVQAGTIDSSLPGVGPGMGMLTVPAISTPNPANDNQTGGGIEDNNITVPLKRFDHPGYIDLVFNVVPDLGVTEYKVIENTDNNTGTNWSSYSMYLGFGSGAQWQPSIAGDGLDFDAPDHDVDATSSAFALLTRPNEDTLTFSSGIHSSGTETYTFRIDVPDGYSSFTIRQVPTFVPEPSSVILLLCGGVALLAGKRYARS